MKPPFTNLLLALLLSSAQLAVAEEYEVGQHHKEFTHDELTIKLGDSVRFTNQDSFYHNIYSLSESHAFDLGSYPKGQYGTVIFENQGDVTIECAIHPQMHMTIHVKEKL